MRMYVIIDRKGRRMVMPRATAEDAIEQIAKARAQGWNGYRNSRSQMIDAELPILRKQSDQSSVSLIQMVAQATPLS